MHVLDSLHANYRFARTDSINRLECSTDNRGADLVEGRSQDDFTLDSALVVGEIHVNVPDASSSQ